MKLKNLLTTLLLCLLHSYNVFSNEITKQNPRDTIAFNEGNTNKVIALGNFIEASINNNKPDQFISKFYKNVFIKRVMDYNQNIVLDKEETNGFIEGIEQGISAFPNKIIEEVQNGSYYNFIKYRYDQEQQTYYVLFRLYSSETGLNYHDYRIHKKDGVMLFSDTYIYLTGEIFSNTFARIMSYAFSNKKILGVIKLPEDDGLTNLIKATRLNKIGAFKESYKLLDNTTSAISKDKFFMIFKSLTASHIDDEKYLKSLEELIALYENDPTIALNKIDYYIYKNNYFEAIQVVDQLQTETEDDFLNFFKATIAFQDQNYDFALHKFKYMIENYDGFFEGQSGYLNTLVMLKKFNEATTYLDSLIKEGYDRDEMIQYIEEDDEFGENILNILVESEDYKSWKLKTN
ncbi:tetratricopeptide repeat protein [Olleya sp. R77988]|uniref:tetratricopeptide repeat protein n=1 Tax=Olleya sp. R77988 TaxID=3093875 RepID=UPI0037C583DA